MKKLYKVTSPEGVAFGSEQVGRSIQEGDEVKLETGRFGREETALVAAGWLEPVEEKDSKKGGKS